MAVMPSITGISMSSTMTSMPGGGKRVESQLAVADRCDDPDFGVAFQSARKQPRMTALSSTTITRMAVVRRPLPRQRSCPELRSAAPGLRSSRPGRIWSEMMSLSKGFMMYSFAPALERLLDMRHVVLGRAEDDLRRIAAGHLAQPPEEIDPVHDRHVPVEQDRVRHLARAGLHRLSAVLGLGTAKSQLLQDLPRHLADDAAVIDDKAGFHRLGYATAAARVECYAASARFEIEQPAHLQHDQQRPVQAVDAGR